jgi:hypothetical protein
MTFVMVGAHLLMSEEVGDVQTGADGRAGPEGPQGKRAAKRESSMKPFLRDKIGEATRTSCSLHLARVER